MNTEERGFDCVQGAIAVTVLGVVAMVGVTVFGAFDKAVRYCQPQCNIGGPPVLPDPGAVLILGLIALGVTATLAIPAVKDRRSPE